jgi:cytochrome c553
MKYVRNPAGSMPPYTKEALPDTDLKAIFAFLQSFPAPAQEENPGGDAKSGETTFTNYGCYECYGRQGQGSSKTSGLRLGPVTLSFSAFKGYVRHPAGSMPPYTAKVMSDSELANVYAFLKSRPTPQPASAIPLLNQ